MDKIDKVKVKKLVHKLGLKYNLRDVEIQEIVNSQFEFTAEKYRELDLKVVNSEEELNKLKTTFIYKAFGRLYISVALIKRRSKQRLNSLNLNRRWKK